MEKPVYMEDIDDVEKALNADKSIAESYKDELWDEINESITALEEAQAKYKSVLEELQMDPDTIDYEQIDEEIDEHIENLKNYNELKDAGMKLLSTIAEANKTDINNTAKELDVDPDDELESDDDGKNGADEEDAEEAGEGKEAEPADESESEEAEEAAEGKGLAR